jgi:hypothetical protein
MQPVSAGIHSTRICAIFKCEAGSSFLASFEHEFVIGAVGAGDRPRMGGNLSPQTSSNVLCYAESDRTGRPYPSARPDLAEIDS